jgi:energy-converting hydrogenase Eha subunit A
MTEKLKYLESINTVRPDHHVWSLSAEFLSGVISEGVENTVRKALKAMSKAKMKHKKEN